MYRDITQAKQIINLLLLNNFYPVLYRREETEGDELLYCVRLLTPKTTGYRRPAPWDRIASLSGDGGGGFWLDNEATAFATAKNTSRRADTGACLRDSRSLSLGDKLALAFATFYRVVYPRVGVGS